MSLETVKGKLSENFEKQLLLGQQMSEIIQDPRYKLPAGDPKRGEMIQEAQLRWKQSKTAAEEYIRQFELERKQKGEDFNSDKFAAGYNKMMHYGSLSGADTGELKRRTELSVNRPKVAACLPRRRSTRLVPRSRQYRQNPVLWAATWT